jgi:hypothetical protein
MFKDTSISSIVIAIALCFEAGAMADASAHGGGLDRHGCHRNRSTGDYHCHRGQTAPRRESRDRLTPDDGLVPSYISPPKRSKRSRPFVNCAEARAAGAAPVRRGEPGYGRHLDRDGDGVGCEPRRR